MKKTSNVIIANPLRKRINCREEEEKGVGQIEMEISENKNTKEEKRGRENLYGEVLGNHLKGIRVSPLGVSHCRISIHPQQKINCERNLVVSALTELYTPQYIYIYWSNNKRNYYETNVTYLNHAISIKCIS